jgi:hypothetical protein
MNRVAAFLLGLVSLGCAVAARATTVVPPEFSTLVNGSDYIVHAVVKSVTSEKRARGHGVKIVTRVELDVKEIVAGTPPAPLTLEFLGGRVGEESLVVEGSPHFQVGDEDVLFVSGNGRSICPLYAMAYGRYPVLTDTATGQKFMARADHVPLQSTADIGAPLKSIMSGTATIRSTSAGPGLAPGAFIAAVQGVRNASLPVQRAP